MRWACLPARRGLRKGGASLLVYGVLCLLAGQAWAIILYDTANPSANTTAPTGALAGSGWQYEGQFGSFLGTPIGSDYFVTAGHIGGAMLVGTPLIYQGVSYTTTAAYKDPTSDLCIYQVSGTFPSYAPLYTSAGGEVGQGLVVFGRGTQRGTAVNVGVDQHLGGWMWGTSDGVQRWGQNTVSQTYSDPNYPNLGSFLVAPFSQSGGANEATLSSGDSGGGVFIKNSAGVWELAGINYGVDGPFSTSVSGSNPFNAAMFDTTGLYEEQDDGSYATAANPGSLYATEIAANLPFIDSVVPEPPVATFLGLGLGVALAGWYGSGKKARER